MNSYNFGANYMKEDMLKPYTHILPAGSGKFLYTEIPASFQYWLKIPNDKLINIQEIMKILVNMTYIFDDVQDNSITRRTVPAAHRVYGIPLTINASIYALGLVLKKVMELEHPEASKTIVERVMDVLHGQGIDIVWRENNTCPTEEQYKYMSERKSSAMFLLPFELMQLFSDNKKDYSKLLVLLGIYYEIRDDYCNVMKPDGLEGRARNTELQNIKETSFCEDMTDGKFSWPAIHALRSPEGGVIRYLLKQHTRDLDLKNLYLDTLTRLGSLQYTRDVLHGYNREIRKELARVGGNPIFEAILDDFMDWAD